MVKLIFLFAFSACAYAGSILITGGAIYPSVFEVSWAISGNGFSASGHDDSFSSNCGFCMAPFQLIPPLSSFPASNGFLAIGGHSYDLPTLVVPTGPFALGSVFLGHPTPMPTVTEAGTFDVPFTVSASFCVSEDPHKVPPLPPDPACFSASGFAIAHYDVIATSTPNGFDQPTPTLAIVTPEPGTLGTGMLVIVLMLAAKKDP